MPHQRNPAYCGVCGKWVVGLSQHQTRSMTHLKLYAPIRKRLAEQRVINISGGNSLSLLYR
jgi:hypothetical protein